MIKRKPTHVYGVKPRKRVSFFWNDLKGIDLHDVSGRNVALGHIAEHSPEERRKRRKRASSVIGSEITYHEIGPKPHVSRADRERIDELLGKDKPIIGLVEWVVAIAIMALVGYVILGGKNKKK
jgi:hypothetical protein